MLWCFPYLQWLRIMKVVGTAEEEVAVIRHKLVNL